MMLDPSIRCEIFYPSSHSHLISQFLYKSDGDRELENRIRQAFARSLLGDRDILIMVARKGRELVGWGYGAVVDGELVIGLINCYSQYPRIIDNFLSLADDWARDRNVYKMILPVTPEEHPVEQWSGKHKRYKFKLRNYTLEREISPCQPRDKKLPASPPKRPIKEPSSSTS